MASGAKPMDIDVMNTSIALDLPSGSDEMDVDPPAAPTSAPLVSSASTRSVPNPPAVLLTTSDSPSCAKAKLDELFVRYLSAPESKRQLSQLLDDARTGKDIRRSASNSPTTTSAATLPGSPVSRLISNHSPFGDASPRSPRATARAAASLANEIDLGRSSEVQRSGSSGARAENINTLQPLNNALGKTAMTSTTDEAKFDSVTDHRGKSRITSTTSTTTTTTDETKSTTSEDVNMANASADVKTSPEDAIMAPADSRTPNGVVETTMRDTSTVKTEQSKLVSQSAVVTAESAQCTSTEVVQQQKREAETVTENKLDVETATQQRADSKPKDGDTMIDGRPPPVSSPSTSVTSDARMSDSTSVGGTTARRRGVPRFYYPCGRDAEEREKRERESIREFFKAQRANKNIDGATKNDIGELVVEVVGVPSYFASLIYERISKWYPYKGGERGSGTVSGSPEAMSADSLRSNGPDATMRDSTMNSTTNGETSGTTTPHQSSTTTTTSTAAPNGANGRPHGDYIREEQFAAYYASECAGRPKEERLFRALLDPASNRDHLIPSDFKALLRALLNCHQGLAFLNATPEFQHRYSETVIERIYFGCTRRHNGRLTLTDIKRSRLLETLMVVDEEEDINRERKYFSYEHFYVLYCRFWELDTNHDLQIDREDLMRYGGHSLTFRIVDRIFGGHARPLDGAERPGMMSYTDFIWFCLSEEDKTSDTAIDYWFRCVDLDGDGLITMYDMEFFYQEQLHRMECFGHEPVAIRDILCQLLDMIKPNAKPPVIRRRDLKKCKLSGNFFNILFNLNKFFALEARDPLAIRQEHATPELTDWDRFAAIEYLRLSAEEEGEEDEGWEDVPDNSAPLMAGEAPF